MSRSNGYIKTGQGFRCSLCNERIPSMEGCTCGKIHCNGEAVERIRFGDEEYDWGTHRCGDCGVPKGNFHHESCNREICPLCGELLNLCDCETEFVV